MFSSNTRLSYKDAPEGCLFTPGDKLSISFSHSHVTPDDHIPRLREPKRSISRLRPPTNVLQYISDSDGSGGSSNCGAISSSNHAQLPSSSSVSARPGDKYHVSLQQGANFSPSAIVTHNLPPSSDKTSPCLPSFSDAARGCVGSTEDIGAILHRLRHPLARSPHNATSLSSPPVAATVFSSRIPRPRRGSTGSLSATLTPTRALTSSLSLTLAKTSTNNTSSLVPYTHNMREQRSDSTITASPCWSARHSPHTTPRGLPARSLHQERLNAAMAAEPHGLRTPSRTHLQLLRTPVRFTVVHVAPATPDRTDGTDNCGADRLETTSDNAMRDVSDETMCSPLKSLVTVEERAASGTTALAPAASPQRPTTRVCAERRGKFAYEPASVSVESVYRNASARLHVVGCGAPDDAADDIVGDADSLDEDTMFAPEGSDINEDVAPVLSLSVSVRSEGGLWGAVDGLVLHGDLCLSFNATNDSPSLRRSRCVSSSPSARGQTRVPSPRTPATPGRRQRLQASHSRSPALSRTSSTRPPASSPYTRTPMRTSTSTIHAHTPRTSVDTPTRTPLAVPHRARSGSSQRRANTPTTSSSTAWPFGAYMQATTTFSTRSAMATRTSDPPATLLFRANTQDVRRPPRTAASPNSLAVRTASPALPRVATIATRNTRPRTDSIPTSANPTLAVPRPKARVRPRSPSLQPTPSPAHARVPAHARAEADVFKTPRRTPVSRRCRSPHGATDRTEASSTALSPASPVFRTPTKATSRAAVLARLRARHSRFEDTHARAARSRPMMPAVRAVETSSPALHVCFATGHLPRGTPRPPNKRFRARALSPSPSPRMARVLRADPPLTPSTTPANAPASLPTHASVSEPVLPSVPVSLPFPPAELPADPFLAAFARAGVSAALLVAASAPNISPASPLSHAAAQAYDDALPALPAPTLVALSRRLRPSAVELGGGLAQALANETEGPYSECGADDSPGASSTADVGKASLFLSPVSLSLLQQTPWAGAAALLSPVRERREEEEAVHRNLCFETAAGSVVTVIGLLESSSTEYDDFAEAPLREAVSTAATSPDTDAEDPIKPISRVAEAVGCVDTTIVDSVAVSADSWGNVDEGKCEDTGCEVQLAMICATCDDSYACSMPTTGDNIAIGTATAGLQAACDGMDAVVDQTSGASFHTTPRALTECSSMDADLNVLLALDSLPVCVNAEFSMTATVDRNDVCVPAPPDSPNTANSPIGPCVADASVDCDVHDMSVTTRVDDSDNSDARCALKDVSIASVEAWPEERAGALSISLYAVTVMNEDACSEAAGECSQLAASAAATDASMFPIVDAPVEEAAEDVAVHVSVVFEDDAAEDFIESTGARCCSCTVCHGANDCAMSHDGSEYGFGCGHAVGDVHSLSVCASVYPAPALPRSPRTSSHPVTSTTSPASPVAPAFSLSATRIHAHLPRAGVAALLGLRAALVSAQKACPMRSRSGKRVRRQEVFTQFRIDYERACALLRGAPVAEAPVEMPECFSQRLDSSASSVEEAGGEELCTERERAALHGLEELHTPSVSLDFAASDEAHSGGGMSMSTSMDVVNARIQCPLSASLCVLPSQRVRENASCWTSADEDFPGDVSVPDASEAGVRLGLDQRVYCVDAADANACVATEGASLWGEQDASICVSGWSDGDAWMRIARSEGDARPSDDDADDNAADDTDDGDSGDCAHSAAASMNECNVPATTVDTGVVADPNAGSFDTTMSRTAGLGACATHTPAPREYSIPLSYAVEAPLRSIATDLNCSNDDADGDAASSIRLTVVNSPTCSTASSETCPLGPITGISVFPVDCCVESCVSHIPSSGIVREATAPVAPATPTQSAVTQMPLTHISTTCTRHSHSQYPLPSSSSSPSTPSMPTCDGHLVSLPPPSIPLSSPANSPYASPTTPLTDDSFAFLTPARPPRSPSGILSSALSSPRTPNRVTFKPATPSPIYAHTTLPTLPPAHVPLATGVDVEDVQPSEAYGSAHESPMRSQGSFSSLSCWSSAASSVFAEVRYYYPESSDSDSDASSFGVHTLELSHGLPLAGPATELPAADTDRAARGGAISTACTSTCDSASMGDAAMPALLAAHSASLHLSYAQVPHYEDDDSHSLCSLSSAASVSCLSDLFSDDTDSLSSAPVVSPLQRLGVTSPTLLTRTPTPACGLQAAPASSASPLSGGGTLRRGRHSSTDPSIALPVCFPSAWASTDSSLSPVLSPIVPPTTPARTSTTPLGALHDESPMFGASPSCHSLSSAFSVSDIDALFSSDDEASLQSPRPRTPQPACPTESSPSTPNARVHPLSGASPVALQRRSFIPLPSVPVIFEEAPPPTPAVTLPVVSFRAVSPAFSCAATPAEVDATARVMPLALAPPGDHPLTRLSTRARASLSPHIAHRAQQRNPTIFSLVLPLPHDEARASPSPSPSVSPPRGSSSQHSIADAASLLSEDTVSKVTTASAQSRTCIIGRSSQQRALSLRVPVFAPSAQVTASEVEVSGAIAAPNEASSAPPANASTPVEVPGTAHVEASIAPAGVLPRASPYTCNLAAAESSPKIATEPVRPLVQPRHASLRTRLLTLVTGQLRTLLRPLMTSGIAAMLLHMLIAVVRPDTHSLTPLFARAVARSSPFAIAVLQSPCVTTIRAYIPQLLAPMNALVLRATHSLPIPRWLRSQQCLSYLHSVQQLLYALMWTLTAHRCCDAVSEWMHGM